MRFAHARPATVTLVAGSVLITATSGFSLAAVMGATSAWAHPSGYAMAADDAAAAASDQSCQPLKRGPAAHLVADAHSDAHRNAVLVDAPTPTATKTDPSATSSNATPTPTALGQREHKRQPGNHVRPQRRRNVKQTAAPKPSLTRSSSSDAEHTSATPAPSPSPSSLARRPPRPPRPPRLRRLARPLTNPPSASPSPRPPRPAASSSPSSSPSPTPSREANAEGVAD